MVTAFSSPEIIAQKAQVPDITPDPTAPRPPAADLVDDASTQQELVQRHTDPETRNQAGYDAISNQTQVPGRSRRKPQRPASASTSWKPRQFSSCPQATRQCGRPMHPSSMTSTCTTAPRRT